MSGYYFAWHDKCYILNTDELSFSDAQTECEKEYGGNLASIPDQYTQDFIEAILDDVGTSNAWIGGEYVDGSWTWLDGTKFNFDLNIDGDNEAPDNGDIALHIYVDGNDEWGDDQPDDLQDYICQF